MFINPLSPTPDRCAFLSFKVDETVYADPWFVPHIPDYSHLPPIGPREGAWDRGRCVVWVHEDQAR